MPRSADIDAHAGARAADGTRTRASRRSASRTDAVSGRPVVAVLSTGGTIDSVTDPRTGRVPSRSGDAVSASLPRFAGFDVRTIPILAGSSFALTAAELNLIRDAVAEQLADPQVVAVVLTHGTDTLEETAFLLQLFHGDSRPVVLTGAIRPADDPDPDGPRNLHDAVLVAASTAARNRGVLVVFDGQIFGATGTRKVDTTASAAFDSPDGGPVGSIRDGRAVFLHAASASAPLPAVTGSADLSAVRVDIVTTYPGADDVALRAHAAAGARGVVLEATGSGNTPPSLMRTASELISAGVIVVLSSRVHRGSIAPLYGGPGGGRELAAAGAIPTGWMRPSQARIALLALLAAGHHEEGDARASFALLAAESPLTQRLQL